MGGAAAEAPSVDRRDWAGGLPADVLAKVAEAVVAQTEAGWAAHLKGDPHRGAPTEESIQKGMAKRQRDGNCLFVFARVCKEWHKAQLKVGGPLRTRVKSDVLLPGRVALAKWALAEGCPRRGPHDGIWTMAVYAAQYGHLEVVRWLIQEQGFAMDELVMEKAAESGNLELVQWLRNEGCPWSVFLPVIAVDEGDVEMLRWARENGCVWDESTREDAEWELGYTDDFGNVGKFWDIDEEEDWEED